MQNNFKVSYILLALFFSLLFPTWSYAVTTILGVHISYSADQETAQANINANKSFEYKAFKLQANFGEGKPFRYVIDIKDAKTRVKLDRNLDDAILKNIRTGVRLEDGFLTTRIVFDLYKDVEIDDVLITEKGNNQLVVIFGKPSTKGYYKKDQPNGDSSSDLDLKSTPATDKPLDINSAEKTFQVKAKVVLDPGHGGIDPGAQANGVTEKNIVLSISRILFEILEKDPYFDVEATRQTDKKIPLMERVKRANQAGADIFISIHADALPSNPEIKGASVYTLSEKASDALARGLARNQNIVDGFDVDFDNMPSDLKKALSEIQLQAKSNQSAMLAQIMLKNLSSIGPIAFKKTHSANFAVLRSSISAILIETGFITNKEDAKRLSSKTVQKRIAQTIFKGLREYKNKHLIVRRSLPKFDSKEEEEEYRVQNGDTLYHIAQLYNIRVTDLKKRNNLTTNDILIGQVLVIPNN